MMEYPEHEKLNKIHTFSQKIGEFLDWIGTQDLILCRWHSQDLRVAHVNIPDLLAKFFDIDPVKLEEEKRHMLTNLGTEKESPP